MTRERILERERRWARPAGLAAIGGLLLFVGSFFARSQVPIEDASSAQLVEFDEHSGALIASAILAAAGFLLLSVPLLHLFRAAQARNPRVQGALIAFCFIGPVLIAAQSVVNSAGIAQVSSDFVEQAPSLRTETYDDLLTQVRRQPDSIEKVTVYTDAKQLDVELTDSGLYKVDEYPDAQEDELLDDLDAQGIESEEDGDGVAGDVLAEQLTDDSSLVEVGTSLLFPAALALIIAMVYVPLQAMRVGLLTRFFGSLGMALGVSVILLPTAPLLVALWFGWLGLIFLGRIPGGRPPAWEAGEAVPWPAPGEERPEADESGTIEGNASEVGPDDNGGAPQSPPRQSGERRKRKRRR